MTRDIFDMERLPPGLDSFLRDTNPWWKGKPGPVQPPYRRWAFQMTRKKLMSGLAPVVILRGARQVGKTTLQQQLIQHFLSDGTIESKRVLRIQFDDIPSRPGAFPGARRLCRLSIWNFHTDGYPPRRCRTASMNPASRVGSIGLHHRPSLLM